MDHTGVLTTENQSACRTRRCVQPQTHATGASPDLAPQRLHKGRRFLREQALRHMQKERIQSVDAPRSALCYPSSRPQYLHASAVSGHCQVGRVLKNDARGDFTRRGLVTTWFFVLYQTTVSEACDPRQSPRTAPCG